MNKFLRKIKTTLLLKSQVGATTRRLLFFVGLLLSLGTTLFVVNAYNKRDSNLEKSVNSRVDPSKYEPVNAPAVTLAQGENLQVKSVTLTSSGFDPDELISSNPRFILNIENKSGLPGTFVTLSNLNQAVLQTASIPRGKTDYVKAFDFQAGTYILSEASHPEWKCTITVKPKQ